MGKWKKRQSFVGDKRAWTVFVVERGGERPTGRMAQGQSFVKVYQGVSGKWKHDIPRSVKNVGWLLVPREKLKKVM